MQRGGKYVDFERCQQNFPLQLEGYRQVSSISFTMVCLLLHTHQTEIAAQFYSGIIFNLCPDTALTLEALRFKMPNLNVKLAATGFSNYALVTGDSEIFSGSLTIVFSPFPGMNKELLKKVYWGRIVCGHLAIQKGNIIQALHFKCI